MATPARVELGLYYFAAYCVLSLVVAHVIDGLAEAQEPPPSTLPGAES